MKTPLLAGVAVLLLATGAAHAEMYIPQKYRGLWCSISGISYYRCDKNPNSEDSITISAERISVGTEENWELCGIGIGWPTKKGHIFTVGCPKKKISLGVALWLDTRGRLHIEYSESKKFDEP